MINFHVYHLKKTTNLSLVFCIPGCFVKCATTIAFRVLNSDPMKEKETQIFVSVGTIDGLMHVGMLFRCNLALVGGGP